MKKGVIIAIVIIYIVSIIAVGFLGGAVKSYYEKKYVETITCTTEGYVEYNAQKKTSTGCEGIINCTYDSNEPIQLALTFEIKPSNADNKELKFIINDNNWVLSNQTSNTVVLTYVGSEFGCMTTLTVQAQDNKQKEIRIQLFVTGENPFE